MYSLAYPHSVADQSITENVPEEGISITKHGKPLARVVPVHPARQGSRIKLPLLRGTGQPGPLCPSAETRYDLVFD